MSDDEKEQGVHVELDGIHVGDYVMRPVPAGGTDDHLDTPQNRDRARLDDPDASATQYVGDVTPAASPAAVDASIEEARARAAGAAGEVPVPIVVRDPITGEPIGTL
jgi:hypothetical protein